MGEPTAKENPIGKISPQTTKADMSKPDNPAKPGVAA
jgi:hypothetical protein